MKYMITTAPKAGINWFPHLDPEPFIDLGHEYLTTHEYYYTKFLETSSISLRTL